MLMEVALEDHILWYLLEGVWGEKGEYDHELEMK